MLLKVSQGAPQYPNANARYITDDIPSSMIAGKSYTVNVTYENTGDVIWSEANRTRLADKNAGYSFASGNRAYMGAGIKVPNGSQYTFTYTMTAPLVYAVTNYTVKYNMYWDGYSGWFGDNMARLITVNPDPDRMPNAQFVSSTIPTNMTCGEFYDVSVTFMNTGNIEWNSPDQGPADLLRRRQPELLARPPATRTTAISTYLRVSR